MTNLLGLSANKVEKVFDITPMLDSQHLGREMVAFLFTHPNHKWKVKTKIYGGRFFVMTATRRSMGLGK